MSLKMPGEQRGTSCEALPPVEGTRRTKPSSGARGQSRVRDGASLAISEKDWRQVVVDYARLRGWLVYFTWRSDHSPAGFPDLAMTRGGRFIVAELKTEAGRLRPEQARWIEALSAVRGMEVYVWRPSDWVAVRDALV